MKTLQKKPNLSRPTVSGVTISAVVITIAVVTGTLVAGFLGASDPKGSGSQQTSSSEPAEQARFDTNRGSPATRSSLSADCGSSAILPFASFEGCGVNARSNAIVDTVVDEESSEVQSAADVERMTNRALAGEGDAIEWYSEFYISRCNSLEPQQIAAIPECDPATRARYDSHFFQVASRQAAVNNTQAQVALGEWYLEKINKMYVQPEDVPNIDEDTLAAQTQAAQEAKAKILASDEFQLALEWFARAADKSDEAANFYAVLSRQRPSN